MRRPLSKAPLHYAVTGQSEAADTQIRHYAEGLFLVPAIHNDAIADHVTHLLFLAHL
jgi:hypothetical protein